MHGDSYDFKGKGRADGGRSTTSKAAAAQEAAQREAELRAMFVVVPRGDEAKAISCPICKEPLKSEFLEEDEDWVWRNAIKKDDWVCNFPRSHPPALLTPHLCRYSMRRATRKRRRRRSRLWQRVCGMTRIVTVDHGPLRAAGRPHARAGTRGSQRRRHRRSWLV